jgi:uncharacterized peroxidase-related enzyme
MAGGDAPSSAAAFVRSVTTDLSHAQLAARDRAMIDYGVKLTRSPASMTRSDVDALRAHGFDDAAIHDIAQVTALFNYYNRLADGLGIDPEPEHGHEHGAHTPRNPPGTPR